MTLFSFTRFCLRVLADLNEIIRWWKRNAILTIAMNDQILQAISRIQVTYKDKARADEKAQHTL